MSVLILNNLDEIRTARAALKQRGVSFLENNFIRKLRGRHLISGLNVGHDIKSWDLANTLQFLEARIPKDGAVLDMGAFASEMLCILHKAGFTNLAGIDLNPQIKEMPFPDHIRWVTGNMFATPFEEQSFHAVTSISVIEHGFDADKLLSEVSRLLRPDGYFLCSFDYWPTKIDTSAIRLFDMDWRIFSKDEVNNFVQKAKEYGLSPVGDLKLDVAQPTINWESKSYTFGWLALCKTGQN